MKVERLKRLLTLAFLSDKEHERLAALDAIKRVLEAEGRDAHWLVENAFREPPRPQVQHMQRDQWASWLEYLCREPVFERLRRSEQDFVDSLGEQSRRYRNWGPSIRQGKWLYAIYTREKVTEPFG
jgi:hypothetical protein